MTWTINHVKLLLVFIYLFSILVDMYNGYMSLMKGVDAVFPLVYKSLVIVLLFKYTVSHNHVGMYLYILLWLFLFCFTFWVVQGRNISLFYELNNYVKIIYSYIILSFLFHYHRYIDVAFLLRIIVFAGCLAALSICASLVGIGAISYGSENSWGFGFKGFFAEGNSIGLALLMCNCIACFLFITTNKKLYLFCLLLIPIGAMLLGSATGVGGTMLILLLCFFSVVFLNYKDSKISKWTKRVFFGIMLFLFPILILGAYRIITYDSYMLNKYENLLEGDSRSSLIAAGKEVLEKRSFGSSLFGDGRFPFAEKVAKEFGTGHENKAVEVDTYDMIGAYGLVLGGLILLFPIYLCIYNIRLFFRNRNNLHLWMTTATMLFLGHSFLAGHAVANTLTTIILVAVYFVVWKDHHMILNSPK